MLFTPEIYRKEWKERQIDGAKLKGRDGKRKGGKKFHISMLRTIKVEGKNLLSRHNDEGNEKGRETWIINHGYWMDASEYYRVGSWFIDVDESRNWEKLVAKLKLVKMINWTIHQSMKLRYFCLNTKANLISGDCFFGDKVYPINVSENAATNFSNKILNFMTY